MADRNFTEAYQLLANQIRDTYLALVSQKVAQRNRALVLQRTRSQLETVRQQIAQGRLVSSAAAPIQASIESQELAAERADYALSRLVNQFRNLTGDAAFTESSLPQSIPAVLEVVYDEAIRVRSEFVTRRGFEQSGSFFRASKTLDIDRLRLRIIRNETRPKFNVGAGVSQDLDERSANVEQRYMITTYSVGLSVQWAIWDSKSSKSRARALSARIKRDESRLEQLENNLVEMIEAAEKEVGFSTRGLRIAERGYAGAESSYQSFLGMQKEGRASQDEVDAALLAWRNAEFNVCESRRDYLRTVAAFLSAIQSDPLVEKLQSDGKIPR